MYNFKRLAFIASFSFLISTQLTASNLEFRVDEIRATVQKAREGIDSSPYLVAAEQFEKLEFDEAQWEVLAEKKWPGQSAKQAVASQIFFPPEVESLDLSPHTSDVLKRLDYLWQFAIAAKNKDPLGQYYLARKAYEIFYYWTGMEASTEDNLYQFKDELLREAFAVLEQCMDNPHICHILGFNHCGFHIVASFYDCDRKKRASIHQHASEDPHNAFELLKLEQKSYKDFMELAQKHRYGPAYIKASELTEDTDKKREALEAAIVCGYKPSLIELGFFYEDKGLKEQALSLFQKAGDAGLSEGYFQAGRCLIGDIESENANPNTTDIERSINFLIAAIKLGNPNAWRALSTFKKKQDFTGKLCEHSFHSVSAHDFLNLIKYYQT